MAYKTGQGYTLALDLTDSETPTYVDVDVINVDEAFNEVVDTFYKLGDGGFATNVVTALDPEYSFVFKFDDADATLDGILQKRLTLLTDRNVAYQITDNATSEVITGSAVLTSIGSPRNVEAVVEVSVSMKLRGAPTIA